MALEPVPAAVDCVVPGVGVRLRHVPGEVQLAEQIAVAPAVRPNDALVEDIRACLSGRPHRLTILKAVPGTQVDGPRPCPECGGAIVPSLLDCALGENAGLVVERVAGYWCWACWLAVVPDEGAELRRRLSAWDPGQAGTAAPSLAYDTPSHPRSVQIEVTTRCNLRCAYCSHRHLAVKKDVDFDRFLRMLDQIKLSLVDNVDFTGLGEAVLHPHLPDMVREVRRRGDPADIRVVTNGIGLGPDRFAPLVEAGVTSLAISIDSLDAERFARQRGGAKLDKVLANLEELARFRDGNRLEGLRLKIKAVLLEDPYLEAERLLAHSARLGLDMPHFSALDGRELATGLYDRDWLRSGWAGEGEAAVFTRWAYDRWLELTGRPPRSDGLGRPRQGRAPTRAMRATGFQHPALEYDPALCRWAIDACFIAGDGSLLSCCETMMDLPRQAFAHLDQGPLERLWSGALLWGYRLPLALGLLPRGCVGCAQAPPEGRPLIAQPGATPRSSRTSRSV